METALTAKGFDQRRQVIPAEIFNLAAAAADEQVLVPFGCSDIRMAAVGLMYAGN